MFEELYEPLPDRSQYFERLGIPEPAEGAPRDKALLDSLIYAHQLSIPFEDLDIFDRHLNVSLGITDLFDKVIRHKRGGYCFELNSLFFTLLKELGYDVTPIVGRSMKNRGFVYPFTHRATIVELDGQRLFCDVGYGGPMPPCAVPLIDGHEVSSHGQTFRVERGEGNWWTLVYLGHTEALEEARRTGEPARAPEPVTAFLDEPMQLTDYTVLSYYCSTSPRSLFTQMRSVNRRTEDGNVSISDDEFTRVSGTNKETVKITNDEQYRRILKDEFGIVM